MMQKENHSAGAVACLVRDAARATAAADGQKKEKVVIMPVKKHVLFRSKYSSGGFSSRRGHCLRYEVTDVTPLHGYRCNKALPCVHLFVFFSSHLGKTLRICPVCAFHHYPDNLMQDGETAANLQVIKPQWFTVGTASVCTVEAAAASAAVWPGSVMMTSWMDRRIDRWIHIKIDALY